MEVTIPLWRLTFYDTQEYLFSYKTNSGTCPLMTLGIGNEEEVELWLIALYL